MRIRYLAALFGASSSTRPSPARTQGRGRPVFPQPGYTRTFLQVPRRLLTIPTCPGVWSTTVRHDVRQLRLAKLEGSIHGWPVLVSISAHHRCRVMDLCPLLVLSSIRNARNAFGIIFSSDP